MFSWLGIFLCRTQSATFPGLNLAVFSPGEIIPQAVLSRKMAALLYPLL